MITDFLTSSQAASIFCYACCVSSNRSDESTAKRVRSDLLTYSFCWVPQRMSKKSNNPEKSISAGCFLYIQSSMRLVVYEFFSCSTNIPRGLSAYNLKALQPHIRPHYCNNHNVNVNTFCKCKHDTFLREKNPAEK